MDNLDCKTIWTDVIPSKDDIKSKVADLAFSPDGSLLVAAVRNRVLLYSAIDGSLIESLLGHKDTVTSVDFSADGSRFASGILIIYSRLNDKQLFIMISDEYRRC